VYEGGYPPESPEGGRRVNLTPSPLRRREPGPYLSALPDSLFRFIWRLSAGDQLWIGVLAIAVAILDTVPIEVQRRAVNAITHGHDFTLILTLALIYAAIVLVQGGVKLLMNIYRSWVSENAVRELRLLVERSTQEREEPIDPERRGVEISMIVAESEPVGGFIGGSVSQPLQQIGILVSVLGYLAFIQPLMALVSFLVFAPQFVFVPLIQKAVNKRVQRRISILRGASADLVALEQEGAPDMQEKRFDRVFAVDMGVLKLKFSLNFLMNLTHHLGVAVVLAQGGWLVVHGQTQVGTVVAFISGLSTINDPWGDLVTWYQDLMVTRAKYDLIAGAVLRGERLSEEAAALSATAKPEVEGAE
jgi:ABC-type multidrug transport system fused ATPase/permease subunit